MNRRYIILANNTRYEKLIHALSSEFPKREFLLVSNNDELRERLSSGTYETIFSVHWGSIIPEHLTSNQNVIGFHLTSLPFGRGGSPLQNLIIRGIRLTEVTCFQVTGELDGGPVFLKTPLVLNGSAEDILCRARDIIFTQIVFVLRNMIIPAPQQGVIVNFQRLRDNSVLRGSYDSLEELYDHVRMLDGDGYNRVYIDCGKVRISFSDAHNVDGAMTFKCRASMQND